MPFGHAYFVDEPYTVNSNDGHLYLKLFLIIWWGFKSRIDQSYNTRSLLTGNKKKSIKNSLPIEHLTLRFDVFILICDFVLNTKTLINI